MCRDSSHFKLANAVVNDVDKQEMDITSAIPDDKWRESLLAENSKDEQTVEQPHQITNDPSDVVNQNTDTSVESPKDERISETTRPKRDRRTPGYLSDYVLQ